MLKRMWKKIRIDGDCWLWTGCGAKRYGTVNVGGVMKMAHRVMWEQLRGPVPAGAELDHMCGNPRCVNPWHLDPVTHAENVRRGGVARLNYGTVRCIRDMHSTGLWLHRELAEIWGVHKTTIGQIVRGESWAHA